MQFARHDETRKPGGCGGPGRHRGIHGRGAAQPAPWGGSDLEAIFVEHPIQDQLISEIHQKAEDALESIVFALTGKIP